MVVKVRCGDAAFVVEEGGRVLSWNEGMSALLGYAPGDVMGRPCNEVVCGRDMWGNVYCQELCPPRVMSRRCEEIRPFEARFRRSSGEFVRLAVSTICICADDASPNLIVHLLRPADRKDLRNEEATESRELALLVSDIEGSTDMLEHIGEASSLELLHEHNAIVRACLRSYGGSEVQHTGDGLISSFDSPSAATRCAIAIQQDCTRRNHRVSGQPLKLRIGLHSGRLHREESRWFGVAMNEVTRVCAYAEGGQIVITDHMAKTFETKGIRLRSLGSVTLRSIPNPIQLHEIDWGHSTPE